MDFETTGPVFRLCVLEWSDYFRNKTDCGVKIMNSMSRCSHHQGEARQDAQIFIHSVCQG